MTFKSIIHRFDDRDALAEACNVETVTVRQWGNRQSIPSRYWQIIVNHAENVGVALTLDELAKAASVTGAAA